MCVDTVHFAPNLLFCFTKPLASCVICSCAIGRVEVEYYLGVFKDGVVVEPHGDVCGEWFSEVGVRVITGVKLSPSYAARLQGPRKACRCSEEGA